MGSNYYNLLEQIFSVPLDEEKYLIYAPLKRIAFVANPLLVNMIVEECQQNDASNHGFTHVRTDKKNLDLLDFLYKLGFFQPETIPIDEYQNQAVRYDTAVLFLTNQCNLRCSYCYASSGEFPEKVMPWEIAKASIDHVMKDVLEHNLPLMNLGFHGGGEPTCHWDILTAAVDYARLLAEDNHIVLSISGAFNGYWSKQVCRFVRDHFTELSLSFDGLPTIQNRQRPTQGNSESFSTVAQTLHMLDDEQFPYGIRMTVTDDTVASLEENIDFICKQFHPKKIQVEPAFEEGRAKKNRSMIRDPGRFIDQFIKGYVIARKHDIELFYSGARPDAVTQRFCLAACRALIVTPDGGVTTCFEIYGDEHPLSQHFIVGKYHAEGTFRIDQEKLDRHVNRTVQQLPYCHQCFCKWHCAGDCAVKHVIAEKEYQVQSPARCLVNQELTIFLILQHIKESGSLLWTQ